ncbi:uncharacterized protein C8Q71DRAFT_891689, partial [Rhodofomes roseus]
SWRQEFRGTSDALHAVIRRYMQQKTPEPYARYAAYAQSSGTGKSRMNDEFAKKIIYIPVNLAADYTFPPPDVEAGNWFAFHASTRERYEHRMQAFVCSLLKNALDRLKTVTGTREVHERMSLLASEFRKKMSDGMEFGQHGEYRAAFYQSVIEGAKNVSMHFFRCHVRYASRIRPSLSRRTNNKTVKTSAEELIRFLDPWKKARPDEPLVILCFDEAHMLTMSVAGEYDWTRFSELRRVLRMIVGWPIFTLFLSTVGKLEQFVPLPQQETSGRLAIRELGLFAPIVLTPFDILAERISKSNWTLQRVASTHHMAHLGRPLFAAMYDAGDADFQQDIKFAGTKLLHSKTHPSSLTAMQSLACMGVRIPIHFHPTVPPDMVKERILVAQHLRLLLYAGLGFTSVITTCASEPLLAEAAYRVLGTRRWSAGEAVMIAPSEREAQRFSPPLQAVSEHLRDSYLDLGTRGETIAAVLLLDARDRATTFPLDPNELP